MTFFWNIHGKPKFLKVSAPRVSEHITGFETALDPIVMYFHYSSAVTLLLIPPEIGEFSSAETNLEVGKSAARCFLLP